MTKGPGMAAGESSPVRLRRVFENYQIPGGAQVPDALDIGELTVEVDGHNGTRACRQCPFYRFNGNVERNWVDVDEPNSQPTVRNCQCGGDKGIRWNQDFVARSENSKGHPCVQRKSQCVQAASQSHAMGRPRVAAKLFLERVNLFTEKIHAGLEDLCGGRGDIEAVVYLAEINEWNLH